MAELVLTNWTVGALHHSSCNSNRLSYFCSQELAVQSLVLTAAITLFTDGLPIVP